VITVAVQIAQPIVGVSFGVRHGAANGGWEDGIRSGYTQEGGRRGEERRLTKRK
jgi:hypothetical protein